MIWSNRKRRRSGCLSSPCSLIWYQGRSQRRITIRNYMYNRHFRPSRVCSPAFPILYPPLLLSRCYIVTNLLALILKLRCQKPPFTLTATTRILVLATVPIQTLLQQSLQIPHHLHHPNAHLPVSLPLTWPGLPSPLLFLRDGPRLPP